LCILIAKDFNAYQVRVGKIKDDGGANTKQIGSHRGRVHKLAIEPGSSHVFYSCGEDGLVQHVCLVSISLFCSCRVHCTFKAPKFICCVQTELISRWVKWYCSLDSQA
jgi:hypothetical protein